jgi:apolipoprotein N-acyltransferase
VTIRAERLPALTVFLAGVLGVAAFAPFGWYPLACVALAVLFNQWLGDSPWQAFRHGGLFGLGFFGAGVSWVYVSIHVYGHVPVVAAAMVTAALVAFLSLYPAVLGYFLKRGTPVVTWTGLVLVFPAGWILAEWLRGWLFSGFPWLNVGNSQVDSPLAGLAPIAGVYGTGLAVALSAALLVAALRGRNRAASLVMLCVLWSGSWWLQRVPWTGPDGAALQVAIVQGNIAQEEKWSPDNLVHTLTRYRELTAGVTDAELVVWPESAIPAFYHQMEDSLIPQLEETMRAAGATLLTGIPVLDRNTWQYYNGVVSLGGTRGFYYKQHLVPYGEYLPLRGLLGHSLDALAVPNADFTPGAADQPLLQAAGYPVATSICYEVIFGEQLIRDLPQAALLVNVSNDAWFGRSLAPHQHLEMARMRSRETGRPMLRATNTGISAIIDYDGRILARSPQFEEAVLSGRIIPRQGATPYVRTGNAPVVILCSFFLLLPWFAGRVRNRASTGAGDSLPGR